MTAPLPRSKEHTSPPSTNVNSLNLKLSSRQNNRSECTPAPTENVVERRVDHVHVKYWFECQVIASSRVSTSSKPMNIESEPPSGAMTFTFHCTSVAEVHSNNIP